MDYRVGERVYFGRSHGEQTLGEIVKVNPSRLKIKQLESRGSYKNHPIGTVWMVPPALVSRPGEVRQGAGLVTASTPAPPRRPPSTDETMRAIVMLYGGLSPENLTMDGELSPTEARRRAAAIRRELRLHFRDLGREVSEDEAWRWHEQHGR